MKTLITIVFCTFAFFICMTAVYGVPQTVNFQANLTDAGGADIDGVVSMTFRIYDGETGGAPLWTEVQDVTVDNGFFTVVLGNNNAITLPFDTKYWLSIEADGDGEMSPRFELASAPYSFKAQDAETLEGKQAIDFANASHTHDASEIATGTLPVGVIPVDNTSGTVAAGDDPRFLSLVQKASLTGGGNCGLHNHEVLPQAHTHAGGDVTSQVGSAATADTAFDVAWGNVSGKPASYTPDTHTHAGGDVTSQVGSAATADTAFDVDWSNVSNIPAGFADGFDNGITSESDTLATVLGRDRTATSDIINGTIQATQTSTTGGSRAIYGYNSAASGINYGLYCRSLSTSGRAVYGDTNAATGATYGGFFHSSSTGGRGVYGFASNAAGATYGVHGRSNSTTGRGVYGWASAATGSTYGVYGSVTSTLGRGVYGDATAVTGTTYGVYGRALSTSARSVDV